MDFEIKQNKYEHGGCRIYAEKDGKRQLLVDTFTDEEFADQVKTFVEIHYSERGINFQDL